MHRPRATALVLFTLVATVALSIAGCSSSPEEQMLTNYFRSSRMRDNLTLANIAMVSFSPTERGIVQSFSLESIGEDQRRPMRAREYRLRLEEVEAAEEEFSAQKQTYQDENLEAIERILEVEREEGDVRRADREIQEAWTTWREEMAAHAQTVSEARIMLSEERVVAEASTFSQQVEDDITEYEGEIVSREIVIMAQVQTPDGQEVEQRLTVAFEQAELTRPDGSSLTGRWIITRIEEG